MLEKHKKSKVKSIAGVILCSAISLFIVTKAPPVIATNNFNEDELLSLSFQHIDLNSIVKLFGSFLNLTVSNPEILEGKVELITIKLEKYPAKNALRLVLNCSGLDYEVHEGALTLFESDGMVDEDKCDMLESGMAGKDEDTKNEFAELKDKVDHTDDIISLMNAANVDDQTAALLERHNMGLSSEYIEMNVNKIQSVFGMLELRDMKFHLKSEHEYEVNVQTWSEKRQQIYYFNYYVLNSDTPRISGIDFRVENVKKL